MNETAHARDLPDDLPPDPMDGAAARIDRLRKGNATFTIVDSAGKPVPGARVTVEQTRHAFLFGGNIFNWGEEDDRYRKGMPSEFQDGYRERFRALFNFATLPLYFHYYSSASNVSRQDYIRELAAWCNGNGIVPKGHPLLYNHIDPAWTSDDLDDLTLSQVRRIKDIVRGFSGMIDVWDVVNEAAFINLPDRKEGAPRLTAMWNHAGCLALAKTCFLIARQANPNATLLINDYLLDERYEAVIAALVDDDFKPLYDVIGLQSHMHAEVWTNEKTWEVCQRYASFGAPLHITETTLLSGNARPESGPWPSTPDGELRQAREAARIYTLIFSHPAVEAITWWDLADGYAWKGAPAGLLHNDMSPKPAYEELMRLIKGEWWTRTVVTTDARGAAVFRGFFGEYKLTVPGREVVGPGNRVVLKKGGVNSWKIAITQ